MTENYRNYAKHLNANEFVIKWIDTVLGSYLEKSKKDIPTEEVEHIIDYLIQADKKISRMSYADAKTNASKWTKSLQKKGEHIEESKEDTEIVLDFKDGFKIVKLIGKNAYEREGYLMRHCVASYFGKDVEIYSLRDKDNMPHCTMEKDRQVKGKGNGDIHPKYVGYVVKFLEHIGMTVGDSEMKHLGYVNIEKIKDDIDIKSIEKYLFNNKYLLKDKKDEIKDRKGKQKIDLDMLEVFDLIEVEKDSLKIAFDIPLLVSTSIEWIKSKSKKIFKDKEIKSGGYSSQLAGGNSSKLAGGNYSKLAGGDYSQLIIGNDGIAVGDKGSIAKGKKGSLIVLVERDENYKISNFKAFLIDGGEIKEDTWYKLEKGALVIAELKQEADKL